MKRIGVAVGVGVAVLLVLTAAVWAMGPWPGGTMMGGYGPGLSCPGWGMPGMGMPGMGMPGWPGGWPGSGAPISEEEVVAIAQNYINSYGNPDLELAEIMAFDNQFYAQARERSTGRYAFEFLIDRYTGATHPEPGPNMMWNTKYGHMGGWGGMMGGWWSTPPSEEMPITPEEALAIAQEYLDRAGTGWQVADEADPFYGYYTIHVLRDGEITGMLSVNGYTGQVWPHTWHGQYLGMVYPEGEEEGH